MIKVCVHCRDLTNTTVDIGQEVIFMCGDCFEGCHADYDSCVEYLLKRLDSIPSDRRANKKEICNKYKTVVLRGVF